MPDLETPDDDALEQRQTAADPETAVSEPAPEVALETPEADAVEQRADADRAQPTATRFVTGTREADEGDLAESAREVPLDEDDYR